MSDYKGTAAVGALKSMGGAIAGAVTGLFGGDRKAQPPFQAVVDFGTKYEFNQKRIEANATALSAYAKAMSAYKGTETGAKFKQLGGAFAGAITGLLGGDPAAQPPFQAVVDFGTKYEFNNERITANATALASYSKAMSAYAGTKAATDMKNIGSSIGGAVTGLLGGKTAEEKIPFTAITKFQTFEFNQAQIEINAKALVSYAKTMNEYAGLKAATDLKTAGSAIAGGITGLLGGTTSLPYAQMKTFAAAEINKEGIEKNALGLVAFGKAMAEYAKTKPPTTFAGMLGGLYDGALSFFGAGKKELPLAQIKKFGNADLPVEKIKKSAEALAAFGNIKVAVKQTNFKLLAENMGKSIPLMMLLSTGGTLDKGWFSKDIDFGPKGKGGILNPKLRLQEVADKVALVREILTGVQAPRRQASDQVNATGAGGGGGGSGTIVNSPTTVNNSQSNVAHSSRAMIGGPVAANRRSWNSRKQR